VHRMPRFMHRMAHFKHRTSRLKQRMPHSMHRTPHFMHRMAHFKHRMAHFKHRMSRLKQRIPHSMHRMPHLKQSFCCLSACMRQKKFCKRLKRIPIHTTICQTMQQIISSTVFLRSVAWSTARETAFSGQTGTQAVQRGMRDASFCHRTLVSY